MQKPSTGYLFYFYDRNDSDGDDVGDDNGIFAFEKPAENTPTRF